MQGERRSNRRKIEVGVGELTSALLPPAKRVAELVLRHTAAAPPGY